MLRNVSKFRNIGWSTLTATITSMACTFGGWQQLHGRAFHPPGRTNCNDPSGRNFDPKLVTSTFTSRSLRPAQACRENIERKRVQIGETMQYSVRFQNFQFWAPELEIWKLSIRCVFQLRRKVVRALRIVVKPISARCQWRDEDFQLKLCCYAHDAHDAHINLPKLKQLPSEIACSEAVCRSSWAWATQAIRSCDG